jgi:hypothetical protein
MRGPRYLLSTIVVLSLVTALRGQTYVYTTFPQLAVGGGWSCDFFVNNPGLAASSGMQLAFFDDNGAPLIVTTNLGTSAVLSFSLGPGETKIIRASLSGNTTIAGYATLRRPFPSPETATMVVRYKSGAVVSTQLGLPHQYTVEHYSFPVEIDPSTNTNTGVAVANPTFGSSSAKEQTFVISLVAPDGTSQDVTTLTLPAGGHTSMMINDPRLFPDLMTFAGTGTISAARQFGFLALRLEDGALGTVAVEAGSVLPPAQLTSSPVQETEPDDSRAQAQALTLPALVSGTISADGDQDYFSFSGKQGDIITAMAETEGMNSDLDTVVTMQDSSGITVSSNDQNYLFFQNDSFLHLALPADGTYYLRVTSWTGQGGANFVYRLHVANHSAAPPSQEPTIQSISPDQGSPGSSFTVTIGGSNLTGASAVTFSPSSGITVSNVQSTASQVTASISISSGATTGARQVSVTTPGGTSNVLTFTVNQAQSAPTIDILSPSQGTQGTTFTLTIFGSNLSGATAVNFSPSDGITVSNIDGWSYSLTATVTISPTATIGSHTVSVTTPGGTSNTQTFTVISPAPVLSSIMPTLGTPGLTFTITMYGTNLTGVNAINFTPSDGITVSNIQIEESPSRLTASVTIASGTALGARTVSVTNPYGTSNTKTFNIVAPGAYDGTWSGTTGQGKPFSFIIIGNVLTRIDYAASLTGCSFSGWTTTNISLGGTTIDFTVSNSAPSGVSLDVDGSFTDTSHASGTVKITLNAPPPGVPGCYGWVQTTWSATKQ